MKIFKMIGCDKASNNNSDPIDKRQSVMIVDDSRFSRNILRNILVNEGLNIVGEARDGLEAIEKAKELRPEIIFLDVEMPKLDGLGTIPRLLEEDPNVTIIMCTALGQKNVITEATKAGVKAYVLKPFNKESIFNVLKELKDKRRSN